LHQAGPGTTGGRGAAGGRMGPSSSNNGTMATIRLISIPRSRREILADRARFVLRDRQYKSEGVR